VQVGGSFFYQAWGHGGSRIPVYRGYRRQGYVLAPNAADVTSSGEHPAGHSYLLVGWDDELEVQAIDAEGQLAVDEAGEPIMQKGFFLFKNSWGTGWAQDNPFGPGYGWIAYDYVEDHLSAYVAEAPELSLTELCGDGRDNDFNGQTDCADSACATDRACIDPAHDYLDEAAAAIPDNDPAGLVRSIDVTDAGILSGASVSVNITHPYRGDLELTLEHAGVVATLFDRQDSGADDLVRTFDLSDFDGKQASGAWTLTVIDHANADVGTLESWSLELTTCAGGDCGSTPTTLRGMNDTLGVIPDDDPTGVRSDITLTGAGSIATARVQVDITHPFIGDLVISIEKDGGAPVELLREDLVEGNRLMRSFTVTDFAGLGAAGTYTLHVVDAATGDQGTLNSWSLELLLE
jgi:subtilisin-like proprotein convertase family protein